MNRDRKASSGKAPPRNVRQHAWQTLGQADEQGAFVTDLLEQSADALSPVDRRLVWELTLGVQRKQLTLDAVIGKFCRQPQAKVEPGLWRLLRLGCYQLMYLDRIPPHAAVHETVEVAKLTGHPQWCNFANGILRSVGRSLTDRFVDQSSASAYPLADGTFREFDQPIFPDPATDPVPHLSVVWSVPLSLLSRWRKQFGDDELRNIVKNVDRPQTLFLRVNPLRNSRDELLHFLKESGIAGEPGSLPESIRLRERMAAIDIPGLGRGLFSVQDETTMHAAGWLDPQPGETVLDLCAAPGTKTGHLAERMQNRGTVVATDVSSSRLKDVESNCRRLGIGIVETQAIHRDGSDIPQGPFDAVLIDAPCTNTGVIGKRVEVRWRFRPEDVAELALIQQRLLHQAADRLKARGRIVYSTCSLEFEENGQNVLNFLQSRPEFRLVREQLFLPGRPSDGGYLALLQRSATSSME